MKELLGGALGAVARYGVFVVATRLLGHGFPYG
jgi:fluoride ion exporter CrcB/FEX